MKILIISQYFWPENFRINDLALGLQERGHEIHVLTGKPNYPNGIFYNGYSFFKKRTEEWNGIKIYRSKLVPRGNGSGIKLMINYISFAFFASIKVLFHSQKYDLIFVYEPSPITVGIPAVLFSKKTKTPIYFWVQDLWPESVFIAGNIKSKLILKSLNQLAKWIYKNSKSILIQSEGFREYILNQGVDDNKITYFPNSTESLYKKIIPSEKIQQRMPNVPFSLLFAGNIGESQDFENIMEAARILKEKTHDIHFVLLGDGRKKEYVVKKIKEYNLKDNFHLLGAHPLETMPHFFSCSDALLVSLKQSKIFSLTIPGKIQSYLACGKPIIGAIDGSGANIIIESKSGLVAPAGNSLILANKIHELYSMTIKEREIMGNNAHKYFKENFERDRLISKLIKLFNK